MKSCQNYVLCYTSAVDKSSVGKIGLHKSLSALIYITPGSAGRKLKDQDLKCLTAVKIICHNFVKPPLLWMLSNLLEEKDLLAVREREEEEPIAASFLKRVRNPSAGNG